MLVLGWVFFFLGFFVVLKFCVFRKNLKLAEYEGGEDLEGLEREEEYDQNILNLQI